jgi:hypothetical protein
MTENRRRHERYPLFVEVELVDPQLGRFVVNSKDLSESGLFLRVPADKRPAIGRAVRVRIHGDVGGEEPPIVPARVVRITAEGIGLEFVDFGQP